MDLLEKYLLTYGSLKAQSASTKSMYYKLGVYEIRVSDHFSKKTCISDYHILIDKNCKNRFILVSSRNYVICDSFKQLKKYLDSILAISDLKFRDERNISTVSVASNLPVDKKLNVLTVLLKCNSKVVIDKDLLTETERNVLISQGVIS